MIVGGEISSPRHRQRIALPVAALALLLGASGSEAVAPHRHVINIENLQFSPATLTVKRGDRIVWVNKDLVPHTATAADKTFDSQLLAANASWSYTADKVGDFAYGCSYHPTMKAHLIVKP